MLYIIIFYTKYEKIRIKKSYTRRSSTYTLSTWYNNNEYNQIILFSKYLINYVWVNIQH
jgi:hypothetical protein